MNLDQLDDLTVKVNTLWRAVTDLQIYNNNMNTYIKDLAEQCLTFFAENADWPTMQTNVALDLLEMKVRIDRLEQGINATQGREVSLKWLLKRRLYAWVSYVWSRVYF